MEKDRKLVQKLAHRSKWNIELDKKKHVEFNATKEISKSNTQSDYSIKSCPKQSLNWWLIIKIEYASSNTYHHFSF